MLYLKAGNLHLVILETPNLDSIKAGRPAKTPDGEVLIAWTPDPVWLADKIIDTGGDVMKIAKLIDEAAKRPQKPVDRPKHPEHTVRFEEEKDA